MATAGVATAENASLLPATFMFGFGIEEVTSAQLDFEPQLLGLGALINVSATLPNTHFAFAYATSSGCLVDPSMIDLLLARDLASISMPEQPAANA